MAMSEKANAARRFVDRAAREADPENTRKRAREYMKKYRQEHPERVREYQRKWRAKNPDKVKQYYDNYWLKKADELTEKLRAIDNSEEKGNECNTTKA